MADIKEMKLNMCAKLDQLEKACIDSAGRWNVKYIPVKFVEESVKIILLIETKKHGKGYLELARQYNNTVNKMLEMCQTAAKKFNSESVSLDYLNRCVTTIKVAWS